NGNKLFVQKEIDAYASYNHIVRFGHDCKLCVSFYSHFSRKKKRKLDLGLANGLVFHSHFRLLTIFIIWPKFNQPKDFHLGYEESARCEKRSSSTVICY